MKNKCVCICVFVERKVNKQTNKSNETQQVRNWEQGHMNLLTFFSVLQPKMIRTRAFNARGVCVCVLCVLFVFVCVCSKCRSNQHVHSSISFFSKHKRYGTNVTFFLPPRKDALNTLFRVNAVNGNKERRWGGRRGVSTAFASVWWCDAMQFKLF